LAPLRRQPAISLTYGAAKAAVKEEAGAFPDGDRRRTRSRRLVRINVEETEPTLTRSAKTLNVPGLATGVGRHQQLR